MLPGFETHTSSSPSFAAQQAATFSAVLTYVAMRVVNGFPCRNCADAELARRFIDPAHPQTEFAGNEVYVPPPAEGTPGALGVNRPEERGTLGRRLNLRA